MIHLNSLPTAEKSKLHKAVETSTYIMTLGLLFLIVECFTRLSPDQSNNGDHVVSYAMPHCSSCLWSVLSYSQT